ncbi:MAG TPA: ATP-binding cassette domain-containing protein [Bacteroidales bacterium]|nr:ATP-binding cassette domain-containing protein [Bacteroidales bacterium]HRZ76171.1 ATP-binding cassette domain-containing protein [Bacteroidales bacterium]
MIEVQHISKAFGDKQVLKDVSFCFEPGKTNLIIGQSGSGKTVLMKCLVGLFEVDRGGILFHDRDFSAMSFNQRKEVRKEIGMLFQGGALFDSMTVEENVIFPLTMFTNQSREEKKDRAQFCLQRVNLQDTGHLYPAEISGGMKKRVAIARAIAMNPKYLFCDEPNSGLDPKTANVIDNLIHEITHEFNITTVVNTHDMNSVLEIGDNIAFLYQGELKWTGDSGSILRTDSPEINDFVFSTELTRRLKR